MATGSVVDAQNLQKYELALDRLEARKSPKRQRPIVERREREPTQEEAVAAAANALAALWHKRETRSGGGHR
jgi:hypothetical protein